MMASRNICTKYLFSFANGHFDFRVPEMKSIANIFGESLSIFHTESHKFPYILLELPSEETATNIMSRTVLARSVYELWAEGTNYKELYSDVHTLPTSFTQNFTDENKSFRIIVESYNKSLSSADKIGKIENFLTYGLNFGKLNLNAPDDSFHLLEYYNEPVGGTTAEKPEKIFFGRWIAGGQRGHIKEYDVKKRKYIGNTSMEACLSLVMANQARVKKGDFVFDPFVGSGGLLVGAAHYGAYVMGMDIDYQLLHGVGKASRQGQVWRTEDENIKLALHQYGLQSNYIDAFVADFAQKDMLRSTSLFDAIITDPPYGIREPSKKVGQNPRTSSHTQPTSDEAASLQSNTEHVSTVQYHTSDLFKDLLNFAARYLKLGGKLVYWIPVYRPDYREECIPTHTCLKLTYNSEQIFNTKVSRRLITMEKVLETQDESILESAKIEYDLFAQGTFRKMYFVTPEEMYAECIRKGQKVTRKIRKKMERKLERKEEKRKEKDTKVVECASCDNKNISLEKDSNISNLLLEKTIDVSNL